MSERSSSSTFPEVRHSPSTQIKRVLDFDDDVLLVIEFHPNYKILCLYQCSIIGEFAIGGKKLHDPTPIQYCIIANKLQSLKGLFNFMRKNKDEKYQNLATKQYIDLLYNPTISNTPQSLIRLAIETGNLDCLKILFEELRHFYPEGTDMTEIERDFVQKPDYENKTPLTIAIENAQSEIAKFLIGKGADPLYTNEDEKFKFPLLYIFENAHDHLSTFFDALSFLSPDKSKYLEIKDRYIYNDNGHAILKDDSAPQPEGYYTLKDYIERKQTGNSHIYLNAFDDLAQYITGIKENEAKDVHVNAEGDTTAQSTAEPTNNNPFQCQHPSCSSTESLQECSTCHQYFCDEHFGQHMSTHNS